MERMTRKQLRTLHKTYRPHAMSQHLSGSSHAPPSMPYTSQYPYQAPYGQYPGYPSYSQNPAPGYAYQYYPQSQPPYAPSKPPLPTLSLSTPTSQPTQQPQPQPTSTNPGVPATRGPKKPQSLKGTFNKERQWPCHF